MFNTEKELIGAAPIGTSAAANEPVYNSDNAPLHRALSPESRTTISAQNAARLKEIEEETPKSFPQILMEILTSDNYSDIVSWLPHGRSFIIYKKKLFASIVLKKYFKGTKFTSFTRKLNRWGFTRVTKGAEIGSYYHRSFLRDSPELCLRMSSYASNRYKNRHDPRGQTDMIHPQSHHFQPHLITTIDPGGIAFPFYGMTQTMIQGVGVRSSYVSHVPPKSLQQNQYFHHIQQMQWQQFQVQQFQQQQLQTAQTSPLRPTIDADQGGNRNQAHDHADQNLHSHSADDAPYYPKQPHCRNGQPFQSSYDNHNHHPYSDKDQQNQHCHQHNDYLSSTPVPLAAANETALLSEKDSNEKC